MKVTRLVSLDYPRELALDDSESFWIKSCNPVKYEVHLEMKQILLFFSINT